MGKTDDDGGLSAEVTSRLDELFAEDDDSDMPDQEFSAEQTADSDVPARGKSDGTGSDYEDSPAKELKALVFGIDWEISDETMVAFLDEVHRLQEQYADDKILSMFLKLHESIGRYIRAKKARAHPDALIFVTSVFKDFEKVLASPEMTEKRKKRLLAGNIRNFKDFKERVIAREKTTVKPGPEIEPAAEPVTSEPAAAEQVAFKPDTEPEAFESVSEPEELEPTVEQEVIEPAAQQESAIEIPGPAAGDKQLPILENQEALDYIVEELKKTIQAEFHTMRQILKNIGA